MQDGKPMATHKGESQARKPGVLVVDDVSANLIALSAVLAPLGVRTVEAQSGQEALEHIEAENFVVALLDVQMPGMDGFELATRIRQLPNGRELPILFVTAIYRDETFIRKGYALGAADYVVKPFDIDVLRARVRAFTDLFQQREEVRRTQVAATTHERNEALRRVATFERIATATLDSNDVKALLDELLEIFLDGADSAHFASIALGESEVQFVSRALRDTTMRREPSDQAGSPELREAVMRRRKPVLLPTLQSFGVPLMHGARMLGVASTEASPDGSLTDRECSLFEVIADRAGWAVAKHGERMRLLAERNELLQLEQQARRHAELASRAKDEFLATLSHELRTPLNAVLGWSARALSKAPPELKRPLEIIARNAATQARMVDDMLDLSRIMNKKFALELSPLKLKDPLIGALEDVRPSAEAKGVELSLALDESLTIVGDSVRIQQIVWNLLTNAIKFTPKGGRVSLTSDRRDGQAYVTVEDTGQGIAADFLPYMFAPFHQEDGAPTRRHGGLGLGLAIAKELTESHSGRILASSEGLGRGATFTVELPLSHHTSRTKPAEAKPESEGAQAELRLEHLRILVVDDEPDARSLIHEVLSDHGADVHTAGSVSTALQEVRTFLPDVLISDIAMPEADGYQLIREVRALPSDQGGATKAIALTAYARTEDIERALRAGFERHVLKPVNLEQLTSVVHQVAHPGS